MANWEHYNKTRGNSAGTVNTSILVIAHAAKDAGLSPDRRYQVMYDRDRHVIGLAVEDKGYKASTSGHSGYYWQIGCGAALKHWDVPRSRIMSIKLVDGVYELQLQRQEKKQDAEINSESDH